MTEILTGTQFDHLDLSNEHRKLIAKACGDAPRVFLAPMDKGLSGSQVWQARWQLQWGQQLSKLHVFKIGSRRKLDREDKAVRDIASPIEPGFPLMRLFTLNDDSEIALLRQEFLGDPEGKTYSLRQYLQDNERCPDCKSVKAIMKQLYLERMNYWHPNNGQFGVKEACLSETVPWWARRIDLEEAARNIGRTAIDTSMRVHCGVDLETLVQTVDEIANRRFIMDIGPVHGDLHAQNVNVDRHLNLYLIDFGSTDYSWRAIDFIVMEFALKFVVAPANALLEDLLLLEDILERQWTSKGILSCSALADKLHGKELQKIGVAACVVRKCAQQLGAIPNPMQYRMGLIFLTASLATIKALINRVFLFHSLAKQASFYSRESLLSSITDRGSLAGRV